jgi:hypothetical protein
MQKPLAIQHNIETMRVIEIAIEASEFLRHLVGGPPAQSGGTPKLSRLPPNFPSPW